MSQQGADMKAEQQVELKKGVYIGLSQAESLRDLIPIETVKAVLAVYETGDKAAYEKARDDMIINRYFDDASVIVGNSAWTKEDMTRSFDRVFGELRQIKLLNKIMDALGDLIERGDAEVLPQQQQFPIDEDDNPTLH
jgi:hypothetical protein